MDASSQKLLPFFSREINDQIADLPLEISPYIFISEREYLELKSSVGYWQAMHQKAISREQKLKQKILEQEGQIRDLRNRVFGKKSVEIVSLVKKARKKAPVMIMANLNLMPLNAIEVSKPEVKAMGLQNAPIFPRGKKQ